MPFKFNRLTRLKIMLCLIIQLVSQTIVLWFGQGRTALNKNLKLDIGDWALIANSTH